MSNFKDSNNKKSPEQPVHICHFPYFREGFGGIFCCMIAELIWVELTLKMLQNTKDELWQGKQVKKNTFDFKLFVNMFLGF